MTASKFPPTAGQPAGPGLVPVSPSFAFLLTRPLRWLAWTNLVFGLALFGPACADEAPPGDTPAGTPALPSRLAGSSPDSIIRPREDDLLVKPPPPPPPPPKPRAKPKPSLLPQQMREQGPSAPPRQTMGSARLVREEVGALAGQPGGSRSSSQEHQDAWAEVTLLVELPWRYAEVLIDGVAAKMIDDRGLVKYLRMPVQAGRQTITLRVAGRTCVHECVISGKKTIELPCS